MTVTPTRRTIGDRLRLWLDRRRERSLLLEFGGIQTCPWCRQCAQHGEGWSFRPWPSNPMLDVLTCGVCQGTSLWRFELGMMFVAALKAPESAWPPNASYASALTASDEGAARSDAWKALQRSCYIMSEPHLSGARLIIGFNNVREAGDAHVAISKLKNSEASADGMSA